MKIIATVKPALRAEPSYVAASLSAAPPSSEGSKNF
jgi:hypothetical protein